MANELTERSKKPSVISRFADVDRKFPWSFLGWLVGLIALALAVYFPVFYERPTQVSFDIISQARVLDIKDDIGGELDVIYKGQNLSKLKKQLTVFVVRIANSGKTNILPAYFDVDHPFGYKIVNGAFAQKPETISVSRDDLTVKLIDADGQALPPEPANDQKKPDSQTQDKGLLTEVHFAPMMLDEDDFFVQKILAINDEGVEPEIVAVGKISGIKRIEVETLPNAAPPFWQQVFDGSLAIQLTRAGIYFVGTIVVLFLWILAAFLFQEGRRKRGTSERIGKRREVIAAYMKGKPETELKKWATNEFLEHGNRGLYSWSHETPVYSDGTGIVYPPPLDMVCNPQTQTLKPEPLAEINQLRDFIRENYGNADL